MLALQYDASSDNVDIAYQKKITEFKKGLRDIEREYENKIADIRKRIYDINKAYYELRNNNMNPSTDSECSFMTLHKDKRLHTKFKGEQ